MANLNSMGGIGVLNWERAELIYSRKLKSNNYKYLCSGTQLVKNQEGNYVVMYEGSPLVTVTKRGWFIHEICSWNISANNRINAFAGVNFFAHYGSVYAGGSLNRHIARNNTYLENSDRRAMFIPFGHQEKNPLNWYNSGKYNKTPHSGSTNLSGYNRGSLGDLSDPEPDGLKRIKLMIGDAIRLYVKYYLENLSNFNVLSDYKKDAISTVHTAETRASEHLDISDSSFLDTSRSVKWEDIHSPNGLISAAPRPPHSTSEWTSNLYMLDHPEDVRSLSSVQGLEALAGMSVTETEDNLGVPDLIDMHRLGKPSDYHTLRRWYHHSQSGQTARYHSKGWVQGRFITLDSVRYELIRSNAVADLLSFICFGSMLFDSTILPTAQEPPLPEQRLGRSISGNGRLADGHTARQVTSDNFTSGHLGRHWIHIDDLNWEFKDNDNYEGIEHSGRFSFSRPGGTEDEECIRNFNTPYPRAFLLKILELEGADLGYVETLFNTTDSFHAYAYDIMTDFLMRRLSSFLAPSLHMIGICPFLNNSGISSTDSNLDNDSIQPHWYRRGDKPGYSTKTRSLVHELHAIK